MLAVDVVRAIHPAASIFPMDEEHLADLTADIKANGLRVPIEVLGEAIIDGRRRMRACEIAGVTPTFRTVTTDDPVAYVLSLNLHRRHLTPSQLSMVGARARGVYDEQAKARQVRKPGDSVPENLPEQNHLDARDAVGKVVGVSGKSVDYATRVLASGVPELVEAVDAGRIAVSTAAIVAADPPEAQRAFVEATPKRKYRSTKGGGEFGPTTAKEQNATPEPTTDSRMCGVGVRRANEAVDCLKRIPLHDPLRARGFQIVTDWIRLNRSK